MPSIGAMLYYRHDRSMQSLDHHAPSPLSCVPCLAGHPLEDLLLLHSCLPDLSSFCFVHMSEPQNHLFSRDDLYQLIIHVPIDMICISLSFMSL